MQTKLTADVVQMPFGHDDKMVEAFDFQRLGASFTSRRNAKAAPSTLDLTGYKRDYWDMRVRLLTPRAADGSRYSSLTLGAEYDVLGIEGDWLRLVNDRGEPVLYDPACFQVTDAAEPTDWVSVVEDGVRYAYPLGWGRPGFFEDWHDGVAEIRREFSETLAQRSRNPSQQV